MPGGRARHELHYHDNHHRHVVAGVRQNIPRVWAGRPHSPGAVSVEVDGRRDRFSLPRVARFPSTSELVRELRRSGGDLFIENAGATDGPSRVKILGVVSADCP